MRNRLTTPRAASAVFAACFVLAGCSGGDEPAAQGKEQDKEHVWKEQTQAIDKAREVERQLGEAAAKRQGATQ